jgi:UDP-N-acetylmuramyl pentapeptide phosphotransferase/UDP-N-acetylglucosamine-1-phosphate transferase
MIVNNIDYLLVVFVQFALLLAYIYVARKVKIVDIPNHRSSHSKPTVRGGGIIFPLAMIFAVAINGFEFPWFLTGLILISIISFWDDVSALSFVPRIIVHFLSVVLMIIDLNLPWYWCSLLAIPMVAFVNVSNFMDGINGITAASALTVLVTMLGINTFYIQFISTSYILIMLGAVIVFSFFNFRTKAVCFAGDVGSVTLAFAIAFMIALLVIELKSILFLGLVMVYVVDSSITILIRIKKHENITQPHRSHLYQLLVNEHKMHHLTVSSFYFIVQLLVNIVLLFFHSFSFGLLYQIIILMSLYCLLAVLYMYVRTSISKSVRV